MLYLSYSLFLFLGAGTIFALAILTLIRRAGVLSWIFLLMILAALFYIIGSAMEILSKDLVSILFWSKIQYLGIPFLPTLYCIFAFYFVGKKRRGSWFLIIVLLVISFSILIARLTDEQHHLYYTNVVLENIDGHFFKSYEKGPFFWCLVVLNLFCFIFVTTIIARYRNSSSPLFRRQGRFVQIGVLFPVIPYFLEIFHLVPGNLDLIPAAILLASPIFWVATFRHNLFDLVPIGRDLLVETMSDAVFVIDPHGIVADANPAAIISFGESDKNVVGKSLLDAFPSLPWPVNENDLITVKDKVWRLRKMPLPSGKFRAGGTLVVAIDETEREELLGKLEFLARYDPLTGLLNRRSWYDSVRDSLETLKRHERWCSLIYLDLDHFKQINDTAGHSEGDRVLKGVASVLHKGVRTPDLISRYGGEEFLLFLPESTLVETETAAERLRRAIENAFSDSSVKVTGSFGISGCLVDEDTDIEELIRKADRAMYFSKTSGRNRVTVFEDLLIEQSEK